MDLMAVPSEMLNFVFMKILPFIFVLSIVVFFHELGHFLVARWNKVKIDAFSMGFGPELCGFNDKQGTRWKLCAVPLGGYVKFLGDEDATSKPDRYALKSMSVEDQEGAFENKALWRKASIVAAGPIANFILASVIYTGLFMYPGYSVIAPVVGNVTANSAAEAAGIKIGDQVIEVDGLKVSSFHDIGRKTEISADIPLKFVVLRDGKKVEVIVVPRMTDRKDQFGNDYKTGMVGIVSTESPSTGEVVRLGPVDAFAKSLDSIWLIVSRTYHFLRELVAGKQDASQLRGPLGIGQITSQVATLGILELLSLAAALSVSIGLMNLLPVPMLDGGHLVFYAMEAIRGKALAPKVQDIAFRVGLTCVLLMMLFATSNDIRRWISQFVSA